MGQKIKSLSRLFKRAEEENEREETPFLDTIPEWQDYFPDGWERPDDERPYDGMGTIPTVEEMRKAIEMAHVLHGFLADLGPKWASTTMGGKDIFLSDLSGTLLQAIQYVAKDNFKAV